MTNLVHLNNHLMCSISIKTTGIRPWYHDLYEICILPLDADLKPIQSLPFQAMMQLKRPENLKDEEIRKLDYIKIQRSLDPWKVADLFEDWYYRLLLKEEKKIVPLSIHWAAERGFIMDWLNEKCFADLIDENQARDITTTALYLNDKSAFEIEPVPFSKTKFSWLCSSLKIFMEDKNDTLWRCTAIAQIYRKMCLGDL